MLTSQVSKVMSNSSRLATFTCEGASDPIQRLIKYKMVPRALTMEIETSFMSSKLLKVVFKDMDAHFIYKDRNVPFKNS